jgi:hypothetical protein
MRIPSPTRIATLSLLVGGLACAKNSANEDVGAARDTTKLDTIVPSTTARDTAGVPDSVKPNQSKSGVTDTKTGESTTPDVTQTRPDQGQPVTSKGDTLNPAVDSSAVNEVIDSSAINRDPTSSTTRQTVVDSSMSPEGADSSAADSSTTAR